MCVLFCWDLENGILNSLSAVLYAFVQLKNISSLVFEMDIFGAVWAAKNDSNSIRAKNSPDVVVSKQSLFKQAYKLI